MTSILDDIYKKSPVWLQQVGINLYGLLWRQRRFGGNFNHYLVEFLEREHYSAQDWLEYQTNQLSALLLSAFQNVPYYRKLFIDLGINRADIIGFRLADLSRIPVLSKQQILAQPDEFLDDKIPINKLNRYLTSGTTGTPLTIYYSQQMEYLAQAAYEARIRRWAGVNYKMSRAMIGGRLVVPQGDARPPFWRYNVFEKQLYLSAFHIAPANVPDYAVALNRFKPEYLVGYASSHFFLARMIDELGITMYQPKAMLTSSEKLTHEMRSTIEKVYRCEVFDGYSAIEACCQASECEYHRMHISPDVGIIEILDDEDAPVPAGSPGRIIATGLLNTAQPLIRYDTGDIGILSDAKCECGRNMQILDELVGRLEDTVIGADGREMVRFHGIFVGLPHIIEGQVIQNAPCEFTVKLVKNPEFNVDDQNTIQQRFFERLGNINLKFEFVDQIPRTQAGKYKAVISHVNRPSINQ